ncbi:MAG: hypothetical protein AAFO07_07130 [Bacteroidota bacterium]
MGSTRTKMMRYSIILFMLLSHIGFGQSVEELEKYFTGDVIWQEKEATLYFTKDGTFDFPNRPDYHRHRWSVPEEVKKIIIKENTKVTGFFHIFDNCTIEGENQETSIIYGTSVKNLLRSEGLDANGGSPPYSAIYGKGEIVIHVNNLTVLNPFAFMFTGKDGAVFHLYKCRGIDNRGGHHNHSDGVSADDGTTVRECYFEAGDDVIKVYHDIYVENTTIKMITNTVPIQLGWGSYGSGAVGVFKNLTVIGDKGRGSTGNALVDARYGAYDKTLIFEGLEFKNPNGVLFDFWNEPKQGKSGGHVTIRMNDVDLAFSEFQKRWNMSVDLEICGEKYSKDNDKSRIKCR